jgi:peptidylprolyl isomerase
MKEGGERLLVIPANLAYGDKQVGDRIPPNSALIFQVYLAQLANVPGQAAPSYTPPPK